MLVLVCGIYGNNNNNDHDDDDDDDDKPQQPTTANRFMTTLYDFQVSFSWLLLSAERAFAKWPLLSSLNGSNQNYGHTHKNRHRRNTQTQTLSAFACVLKDDRVMETNHEQIMSNKFMSFEWHVIASQCCTGIEWTLSSIFLWSLVILVREWARMRGGEKKTHKKKEAQRSKAIEFKMVLYAGLVKLEHYQINLSMSLLINGENVSNWIYISEIETTLCK